MIVKDRKIPLLNLALSISNVVDLLNPSLKKHHEHVAIIALGLAEELGIEDKDINDIVLAALFHDIGALSLRERLSALDFEYEFIQRNPTHPFNGYMLLDMFVHFNAVADIVRYHHKWWEEAREEIADKKILFFSQVLHLSDRIDILINRNNPVPGQAKKIRRKIKEHSGTIFNEDIVEVFNSLSSREHFWLDIVNKLSTDIIRDNLGELKIDLDIDGLYDFAKMISFIIDFKSRFTATHSSGVAATAEKLASLAGLTERERKIIRIAGYMHDLGKLAVPTEILEKEKGLSKDEINIIRSHTYYTYYALKPEQYLDYINACASYHHERLDGSGYPFYLDAEGLIFPTRIMAVADIFTVLSEERPYRKGLGREESIKVIKGMAEEGLLDLFVVSLVEKNYMQVRKASLAAAKSAMKKYKEFSKQLDY